MVDLVRIALQNTTAAENTNGVVQNSYGGTNPSSADTSNITGAECQGTSGIVDLATGLLTGTFRTQYLGQRGHEIAGDAV